MIMLLTSSLADTKLPPSGNNEKAKNMAVNFRKKDTTVTRQQRGTYRTSLIVEGSGFATLKKPRWSSLRVPKDNEKPQEGFCIGKKSLSVNNKVECDSNAKLQSPSKHITKKVKFRLIFPFIHCELGWYNIIFKAFL